MKQGRCEMWGGWEWGGGGQAGDIGLEEGAVRGADRSPGLGADRCEG
jgi:hypothetical protein